MENFEQEVMIKKNLKDYDFTVLTCFFAGSFGLHRILNGKSVSGIIMLCIMILSLFSGWIPFVGAFLQLSILIWIIVDLVLICTNKFTDKNGAVIGYDGKFLETTSNKVVMWSLIAGAVIAVIFVIVMVVFMAIFFSMM